MKRIQKSNKTLSNSNIATNQSKIAEKMYRISHLRIQRGKHSGNFSACTTDVVVCVSISGTNMQLWNELLLRGAQSHIEARSRRTVCAKPSRFAGIDRDQQKRRGMAAGKCFDFFFIILHPILCSFLSSLRCARRRVATTNL